MGNFIKEYDLKTPVPVIVRPLNMGGYEPEREGQILDVWVNPSRMLLDDWIKIQKASDKIIAELGKVTKGKSMQWVIKFRSPTLAKINKKADKNNLLQYEWYSKVWSMGPDAAKHLTPADVKRFAEGTQANDELPLWKWITNQTQAMIVAHLEGLEKNSKAL